MLSEIWARLSMRAAFVDIRVRVEMWEPILAVLG
jgi:hypothetical protein